MRCWFELKRILVAISGIPELWQLPSLSAVCSNALDGLCGEIEANDDESGATQSDFVTSAFVDLVLRSPFVLQHDIVTYVDKLNTLHRYAASAACCCVISDTVAQRKSLDGLFQKISLSKILDAANMFDGSTCDAISIMIFDAADRHGEYTWVVGGGPRRWVSVHYVKRAGECSTITLVSPSLWCR
eukprot:m.202507 g.202507  ORF g.202507 m.202507 type:complete len:186 (+) comp32831_c0_seq3:85-642(+)